MSWFGAFNATEVGLAGENHSIGRGVVLAQLTTGPTSSVGPFELGGLARGSLSGKGAELRFEGSKFQICPGNGNAMRRKGFDKVRDKVFDKV